MFQTSIIVKGIEKNLIEEGYQVSSVAGDFSNKKKWSKGVDLFIAYLPGDIISDTAKMYDLRDITEMVMEQGKTMIVIGERKDRGHVSHAIPGIEEYAWVDRPVDMNSLKHTVKTELSNSEASAAKKRILIVDDDPAYAKMVREWIKDSYKVDIVTAGMQAITFLLKIPEDERMDLILLDYEMPVVDGPQVLQMLRQDPATADIPVVFLTGVDTREGVSRVMELKPAGYILKSTTREDILGYIREKLKA